MKSCLILCLSCLDLPISLFLILFLSTDGFSATTTSSLSASGDGSSAASTSSSAGGGSSAAPASSYPASVLILSTGSCHPNTAGNH